MARTRAGKAFRMLSIIDESTRECLAIEVSRRFAADAVLYGLTELLVSRRPPDYIPSDNGPEFTARAVRVIRNLSLKLIFTSGRRERELR
jgi:putative transposase